MSYGIRVRLASRVRIKLNFFEVGGGWVIYFAGM